MTLKGFAALLVVLGILWLVAFGVIGWLLEEPLAAPIASSSEFLLHLSEVMALTHPAPKADTSTLQS